MYEVYSNSDGRSFYICNSNYALNQCMDRLEAEGYSVAYTTINQHTNPIEQYANVKRWAET